LIGVQPHNLSRLATEGDCIGNNDVRPALQVRQQVEPLRTSVNDLDAGHFAGLFQPARHLDAETVIAEQRISDPEHQHHFSSQGLS
jgi:hypothetical protein